MRKCQLLFILALSLGPLAPFELNAQTSTTSPTADSDLKFSSTENEGMNKYERINTLETRMQAVAEKINHLGQLEAKVKELETRIIALEALQKTK